MVENIEIFRKNVTFLHVLAISMTSGVGKPDCDQFLNFISKFALFGNPFTAIGTPVTANTVRH